MPPRSASTRHRSREIRRTFQRTCRRGCWRNTGPTSRPRSAASQRRTRRLASRARRSSRQSHSGRQRAWKPRNSRSSWRGRAASGRWGPRWHSPCSDAGARRAAHARATASYDEAVGAYRETVLGAFAQDVEDNLAAQRLLSDESARQQAAVAAARQALDISLNQYRAGLINYLQVAIGQTTLLSNQRAEVSLSARRYAAAIALIRAVGGGWNGQLGDSAPAGPTPAAGAH